MQRPNCLRLLAYTALMTAWCGFAACSSSGGGNEDATGGSSGDGGGAGASAGSSSTASDAPTWSQVYADHFASGTAGNCVDCHSFGKSATALYDKLKSLGQIDGTNSKLVTSKSILTWYGGSMPKDGSSDNAAAKADLEAWVAAGALND